MKDKITLLINSVFFRLRRLVIILSSFFILYPSYCQQSQVQINDKPFTAGVRVLGAKYMPV